jgi:hypothetical protein
VAARLSAYETRYANARDERCVFAFLYGRLTQELEAALRKGEPEFRDPDWVADLAVSLAAEYFSAMDQIDGWVALGDATRRKKVRPDELPDDIPEPWRDVYVACGQKRSYVLEDALFSMMAHVSFDLPIALQRMSITADVRDRIGDFHRMNDVLGSAIDDVQEELSGRYSRALAGLDRLFTRNDELLTNYGVRLARGLAWFNFERLSDPLAASFAARSISTSTGAFIRALRSPGDWRLRLGLRIARFLLPERRKWPKDGSSLKSAVDGEGPVPS